LSELISGGATTDFLFAGGLRIGRLSGAVVNYYHTDALGSTRIVTSATKAVQFSDNYQPFGQDNGTPSCSGSCETYKFTGKPFSATTGLYYYFHRWYDPSTGRFISPDPKHGHLSNPQSLNLYIYVIDRPTSLTDPTGLDWWNPWSWTPQQQAQAFTIAVIVVSVIAVVATAGAATPLAAWATGAVVGAAIGASTSTAIYTLTQGDKATLAGAGLSALTGAVAGAIGGGVGGWAVSFAKAGGSLAVGMLAAGGGQALGSQVGKLAGSLAGGKEYKLDPLGVATDFFIGATTFGAGGKLGMYGDAEAMAATRIFGVGDQSLYKYAPMGIYDSPFVSAYYHEIGFIEEQQGAYEFGTHIVGALSSYFA